MATAVANVDIRMDVDFDESERKLQAFQGAIDLIGGSVEAVVGGMALFGIETEFIEDLEQGALGAIAFADGIKRMSDGAISLAKNTNIGRNAQLAFNAVANLNPYILAATAVALAAAGAYFLLMGDDAAEAEEEIEDLNTSLEILGSESIREGIEKTTGTIKKLMDKLFPEEAETDLDAAINAVADIQLAIEESTKKQQELEDEVANSSAERVRSTFKTAQYWDEERLASYRVTLDGILADDEDNIAAKESLFAIDAVEQVRAHQELQFNLTMDLENALRVRSQLEIDSRKTTTDVVLLQIDKLEGVEKLRVINQLVRIRDLQKAFLELDKTLKQSTYEVGEATETATEKRITSYYKALNTIREETVTSIGEIGTLFLDDLAASAAFADNLMTIFIKDDEERNKKQFELSKKVAITTALINGALAVTEVLKDPTIPSTFGKILAVAGVAAATGAQVATISRTSYGDGDIGDLDASVGGGGGNGGGNFQGEGVGGFEGFSDIAQSLFDREQALLTPGGNTGGPVKAYVVTGEISSGLEAQNQINNRRRFN